MSKYHLISTVQTTYWGSKDKEAANSDGSSVTKSDTWVHVVYAKNEEWSFLARKTHIKVGEGMLGDKKRERMVGKDNAEQIKREFVEKERI